MDSPEPSPLTTDALGVLRALEELGESDDAGELLRRGLRVARTVTGAGIGVLAVDDEDHPGWVAQVVTEGVDSTDPRAFSLLDGHPEDSAGGPVLRARIRVAGQGFGTLHLADWPSPPGPDRSALLAGIAGALGPRIETLRQRRVSELHEAVTQTVWELNRTLVDQVDLEVTLPLLVQRVLELTSAEVVALVATRPAGGQRVLSAAGEDAGAVLAELSTDLVEVLGSGGPQHWSGSAGEALPGDQRVCTSLVPLDTRADDPVVLVVHRWKPSRGVTQQQVRDVLSALALHASLVLDRERGEREHDLLTLLQDRDRIARDLHDLVIQRLFAVGLTLQGASRRAVRPEVIERLEGAVAELDQTIRDIRATIFELRHRPGEGSFRADLRQLVESYTPTLGFAPVVHLVGPLDFVTDDEVQTQVLMVVREALSNVARHAHAGSATVEVETDGQSLRVVVRDDGVGIGPDAVESGLGNVRARALEHGGAVELSPGEPHGTVLRWSVPV